MREKVFAIGDDYWIENDAGERAFKVDGKALRIRDTFRLEDTSGAELFSIQEKKLRIRDTMEIEQGGHTVATVKKVLITPLRDRFSIDVDDGADMEAKSPASNCMASAATDLREAPAPGALSTACDGVFAAVDADSPSRTSRARDANKGAPALVKWMSARP
jgi:hypothetical protein